MKFLATFILAAVSQEPAVRISTGIPAQTFSVNQTEHVVLEGADVPGHFWGSSLSVSVDPNIALTWTNTSAVARTVELELDLDLWLLPQLPAPPAEWLHDVVPTVTPDPPPIWLGDCFAVSTGPVVVQPGATAPLSFQVATQVNSDAMIPAPLPWDGSTLLVGQVGHSSVRLMENGAEVTDGAFSWLSDTIGLGTAPPPLWPGMTTRVMFDPLDLPETTTCAYAGHVSIGGVYPEIYAEVTGLSVAQSPMQFVLLESFGQGALGPGGILCLDWPINRHLEVAATLNGIAFDWTMPLDVPGWQPGETRHFQVWYRDAALVPFVTDSVAVTL